MTQHWNHVAITQSRNPAVRYILEVLIDELGNGGMDTSYQGHDYEPSMERAVLRLEDLIDANTAQNAQ